MFNEFTLEDICTKITDGAHHSPKSVQHGKPMASVKDLTPYGITLDTCRHISESDFQKLVKQHCQPKVGDVLIAKDGATALDTVCEIVEPVEVVLLSSVAILRPDLRKIIPSFLRYYLDAPSVRAYMKGAFTTGAAIPRVILKDFKKTKIIVPALPVQNTIVYILSAYDDLIENNLRRIKILEEMAQMIYREWFVNFRFPGHEKVKMVDSKLGKIPEGWRVETLGDLTSALTKGTTPTTLGKAFTEDGISFFKVETIDENGHILPDKFAKIDEETHALLKRSQIQEHDILFSIAGAIGRTTLVPSRVTPANTNQALAIIRISEADLIHYMYSCISAPDFINFSLARVVQTAQANVSLGVLKSAPILIPSKRLVQGFNQVVIPYRTLIDALQSKNTNLRTARDLLLPKLISGELDISRLNIRISPTNGQNGNEENGVEVPAKEEPEPARKLPETKVVEATKKAIAKKTALQAKKASPTPRDTNPYRPTPIDDLDTDEVMAAFRQVARNRGAMSREELIREVSHHFGYQRLSQKLEESLRGHLRAAIRRKIIGANGSEVFIETLTMESYERDELVDTICSGMRKNKVYDRDNVIRQTAYHLGFKKLIGSVVAPIKSAINAGIRRGLIDKYGSSEIWRV